MEQTEEMIYIIKTRVCNVEHRSQRLHVGGFGQDAVFRTEAIGWFVHFEGSWEAIFLGKEKPSLVSGDHIEIKIQKANHAKLDKTSIKQVREAPPAG